METAISKQKGFDNLVSGYSSGKVEEEREINVVEDDFSRLLSRLNLLLRLPNTDTKTTEALPPTEIDRFLQHASKMKELENYNELVGPFISRVVQNSYYAGHNNFHFETDILANALRTFADLKGYEDNPLKVNLKGDVGDAFCPFTDCIECVVDGNIGSWAYNNAKHGRLELHGNAAEGLGFEAQHTTFEVHGNIEYACFNSTKDSLITLHGSTGLICASDVKDCTFYLYGKIGLTFGRDSRNSTFKTTRKDNLYALQRDVGIENKLIYIHPDGREEIVKDYREGSVQLSSGPGGNR